MHEVLVNRLEGLSLPRKSVVRLTDRPDLTLDVYRGRKTTIQQQIQCQGVILIWLIVGQGPTALAEGAGRGFDIFTLIYLFFLPLFGRRPDID